MAGHLPLVTTDFHVKLVEEFKNNRTLQMAPLFERIRVEGFEGFFQRLTDEYNMDEETGLEDSHIFFYCGNTKKDEYFEVHLDKDLKINQVYLVM
jgi:hypothetical protein